MAFTTAASSRAVSKPLGGAQQRASKVACRVARPDSRRALVGTGLGSALLTVISGGRNAKAADGGRQGEFKRTEEEWRKALTPEQFYVLRGEGTERPFSSPLNKEKRKGTFKCAGCGAPLFDASTKYNSGTGWPSFYQALPGAVDETLDLSIFFMPRTEVRCHRCAGHLGHVFDGDGAPVTGRRYCMNGLALTFEPAPGEA